MFFKCTLVDCYRPIVSYCSNKLAFILFCVLFAQCHCEIRMMAHIQADKIHPMLMLCYRQTLNIFDCRVLLSFFQFSYRIRLIKISINLLEKCTFFDDAINWLFQSNVLASIKVGGNDLCTNTYAFPGNSLCIQTGKNIRINICHALSLCVSHSPNGSSEKKGWCYKSSQVPFISIQWMHRIWTCTMPSLRQVAYNGGYHHPICWNIDITLLSINSIEFIYSENNIHEMFLLMLLLKLSLVASALNCR